MSVDDDGTNGGAPGYGEAVERAICDLEGLEYTDGQHADARREDGSRVQIKGTQRFVSNGDGRARGRFCVWSETLTTFVFDNDTSDGRTSSTYVLAVYDADDYDPATGDIDDIDPETFIEGYVVVGPDVVGEAVGDSWQDAHRPAKGRRGRFRWNDIDALADELRAPEVAA